jgi:3',5'-cyclic AMP phosphodiesterase CpdA
MTRLLGFLVLLGFGLPFLAPAQTPNSVTFVQLSDTHWGFGNPKINPDATGTFPKAIAEINRLHLDPDFLVFTGDETHTTGDDAVRRQRMSQFRDLVSTLDIKTVKFLPGEHDVGQDDGADYKAFFGDLHYSFDVKGVHFVALDNVSTPDGSLGADQLTWLAGLLKGWDPASTIVLFAHRPLVDVWAPWDWRTADGAQALALLKPFAHVSLFYGHIHQQRLDSQTGFAQYAARGMMFPLPAPGSTTGPNQVPWDATQPYRGLGFRVVTIDLKTSHVTDREYGIRVDTQADPEEPGLDLD